MKKGEYLLLDEFDIFPVDPKLPFEKIDINLFPIEIIELIRETELVILANRTYTQYKILKSRYFTPWLKMNI